MVKHMKKNHSFRWELLVMSFCLSSLRRRYVKQPQNPSSESRASASFTASSSSSQTPECSAASSLSAGLGSPLSDGASCSVSSSNGSNHSVTCNDTNGLYDGRLMTHTWSSGGCKEDFLRVFYYLLRWGGGHGPPGEPRATKWPIRRGGGVVRSGERA